MNHWTAQASRFAGVGILATVVHVSVAYLVSRFGGANPFLANLTGFGVAFWVSYCGNFYWTFSGSTEHAVRLKRFIISSTFCFFLSNGIVATVNWLHLPFEVALVVITFLIPPLSFALAKFWAFRSLPAGGKSQAPPSANEDRGEVLPS